ncbi:MAG: SpoIIE family protein phosphatase [Chloroflexota bacterium]|nr:SpoIIE family protein phosphatase [Chloroflexota bacterium]
MTVLDTSLEIPSTARFHVKEIEDILQSVQAGTYCAVLGPRLCGKTVMLHYVEQILRDTFGLVAIYIDLSDIKASTLQGFFFELIQTAGQRFVEQTGIEIEIPEEVYTSSAVFRGFLTDLIKGSGRDIVLIIEHLETIPTDLVQALLTSLRAAYMDQQVMEKHTTVVVSGALSLATLTVGESSPFRGIASSIFVGDLSESDSLSLINEYMEEGGVSVTRQAQRRMLRATNGDQYLIRKICQRSINLVHASASERLRAGSVNQIIAEFLRDEVYTYAPLLDATRLVEEDPDLLQCILLLLDQGLVHRSRLPLPLSPDLDPLFLTGVVDRVDGDSYRLQNQIYRQFLAGYFHPGRVGLAMASAGRWDLALDYLESGVDRGDERARADLISATVNAIYASEDLERAAHFLTRGLLAAFGIEEVQVWYALPKEKILRLIGHQGVVSDVTIWANPEIPINADRLEARALRQAASLRGSESGSRIRRSMPIIIPGRLPMGVVTISDIQGGERFSDQRERDQQLSGYLNQVARAFQSVITRRQELTLAGRMQASLLTVVPPEIVGWDFAARLNPARETSGDFYDFIPLSNGHLGIVIADVSDKGMGAALYMALSRTLLRTYAPEHPGRPDSVLQYVNQRILSDTQGGMFVTAFYGVLDPTSGELTYCNAGHNPPFLRLVESDGKMMTLFRTGMALGVSPEEQWEVKCVDIPERVVLALYTDGVVDARDQNGVMFGDQRLQELIDKNGDRPANEIQDAVFACIREFVGEQGQFDDMALVLIRREKAIPVKPKKEPRFGPDVV